MEALKTGYLAAADKRAYIYGLLGPGKAGETLSHGVKNLASEIDPSYQPAGVSLFDFRNAETVITTEVLPLGGGKQANTNDTGKNRVKPLFWMKV